MVLESIKAILRKEVTDPKAIVHAAPTMPISPVENSYYADTITNANEELPVISGIQPSRQEKINILDQELEAVCKTFDHEIEKSDVSFERRHEMIVKLMKLWMRHAVKVDHDYLAAMEWQIKEEGKKIHGTYNTWGGLTLTVISATFSIGGFFAGISPLAPSWMLAKETSSVLHSSSQAVTGAGTGFSSLESIFKNQTEAERGLRHLNIQNSQNKQSDVQGGKSKKDDMIRALSSTQTELLRTIHEVVRSILGL